MGRSETKETYNTAKGENATDFANAQKSYNEAQQDVGNYETALGSYAADVNKFAGDNPYTTGGEYATDINGVLSAASDAGSQSARKALQDQALRTGQNMNAANNAAEDITEANTRNLAGEAATADQARIQQETGYNEAALGAQQGVLSATAVPATLEGGLASTEGSQAQGALGTQAQEANQPSFWDQFALTALQGAEGAATAFCPCEGEPIDLANGMFAEVQNLSMEDEILQFGGGNSKLTSEIAPRVEACVEVETEDGEKRKVAFRHAFKTKDGGYVFAYQSEGIQVQGKAAVVRVTQVKNIGPQYVYPLYLSGNHTYCAGGIWALD